MHQSVGKTCDGLSIQMSAQWAQPNSERATQKKETAKLLCKDHWLDAPFLLTTYTLLLINFSQTHVTATFAGQPWAILFVCFFNLRGFTLFQWSFPAYLLLHNTPPCSREEALDSTGNNYFPGLFRFPWLYVEFSQSLERLVAAPNQPGMHAIPKGYGSNSAQVGSLTYSKTLYTRTVSFVPLSVGNRTWNVTCSTPSPVTIIPNRNGCSSHTAFKFYGRFKLIRQTDRKPGFLSVWVAHEELLLLH